MLGDSHETGAGPGLNLRSGTVQGPGPDPGSGLVFWTFLPSQLISPDEKPLIKVELITVYFALKVT